MAHVRTAIGTATGTSTTTIASVTRSAGDHLVVAIAENDSTAGTSSVTWGSETLALDRVFDTGNGMIGSTYSRIITTGGTQTITVTRTTGAKHAWWASSFTNMAASPADKNAAATGSSASPSSGATTSTVQADENLIGNIGEKINTAVGGTWSNSFNDGQSANTTGGSAGGNASVNEGYLEVAAIATYTAAKTGTANVRWSAIIVTYKGAVATFTYFDMAPGRESMPRERIEIVDY